MQKRVWVLLGRKAGDNNQVLALAESLGWPFEEKHIRARSWELLPHLLLRVTLAGIDDAASSPLEAPWPDLVISAGRRNEPVARWIRRQSGRRTKLVHIGRPWAPLDAYDLIVTTPQYFLPERPHVLHNALPLHRVTPERAAAAAAGGRLHALPQPFTTVLIGGDSGPFVFTAEKGRRMAAGVDRLIEAVGGSVLVTDSPRTPEAASQAFRQALRAPAQAYWWNEHSGAGARDNPYLAYLGLASRFVVTGESMSMLAEADALGKPLYLFDPGDRQGPWWRMAHNFRRKPLSHRLAMRLAPKRMRRDVSRIQEALVDTGRARWLEDAPALVAEGESWAHAHPLKANTDLKQAVARVEELFRAGPA